MVIIKISASAYEQMLIHLLQYGNKNLKKSEEVMGLCYGVRSGDTIEIRKIAPIKHGASCEKPFGETDFAVFGEIDPKLVNEGLECFGFYSSHPKMGFYLSQNEVKNLLYFLQDKKNSYAVAIIGDHMQLESGEGIGFTGFRLKDMSKGASSDFETVKLEIGVPTGKSLYKSARFLIEQAQKRQPYLEEQGSQLKADDTLWDSMGSGETADEKLKKKFQPIYSVLNSEVKNAEQSFIAGFLQNYDKFIDEITQFAAKSLNDPSNDLIAMRDSVEDGTRNVIKWFKQSLTNQLQKLLQDFERTMTTIEETSKTQEQTIKKTLLYLQSEYERLLSGSKK